MPGEDRAAAHPQLRLFAFRLALPPEMESIVNAGLVKRDLQLLLGKPALVFRSDVASQEDFPVGHP